ncbi:MAG TPA: alpha/beta hydrolase [Acidimicrobiia bacterium]|nr:alpha/beta hydrolase [Acidimicrobiia bacterium]
MGPTESFVEVAGHRLHYRLLPGRDQATPLLFLHEGLGSIELWRDFPQRVTEQSGHPGLVFSRYGYGWSQPQRERRQPNYMHVEAQEVLPRLIEELLDRTPILIGHSDGASISIIYAGSGHPVAGLVLLAPHVFTEEQGLSAIATQRASFPESDLGEKMAKYHTDPETTFYGWADAWLSSEFRSWNLERYLSPIECPVLLIQCEEDEYGSLRQLDAIEEQVTGPVERLVVPGSGHSPHLVDPELVTEAVTRFVAAVAEN